MDLWTAFKIWLSGHKLPETTELMGLSVIWWVRLAKAFQFTSGSVVLMEIIGVDRLKEGGSKIRNLISWKTIFVFPEFLRLRRQILSIDWSLLFFPSEEPREISEPAAEGPFGKPIGRITRLNPKYSEANNRKLVEERKKLLDKKNQLKRKTIFGWVHNIPCLTGVGIAIYIGHSFKHLIPEPLDWFLLFILAPIIYFASGFLFLFFLAILLKLPIFLAEVFFLEPIGQILAHKRFKSIILITSYLFLLIGCLVEVLMS